MIEGVRAELESKKWSVLFIGNWEMSQQGPLGSDHAYYFGELRTTPWTRQSALVSLPFILTLMTKHPLACDPTIVGHDAAER